MMVLLRDGESEFGVVQTRAFKQKTANISPARQRAVIEILCQ